MLFKDPQMKQYKTEIYEDIPPFACCLYYRQTPPKNENFLDMLRCTFLPHFQLYSFSFFWLVLAGFLFIYSSYMERGRVGERNGEFMRVSQAVLFQLGENYPYYIVNKYHYYRLFTSIVLFRNLYHFLVAAIGILTFGSYVEELVGFKRVFLLAVTAGVGGELIRNVQFFGASLESLTPVCGLIGYLLGVYVAHRERSWRHNHTEKNHMLLVMAMVSVPYILLGVTYDNISLYSMGAGVIIGFLFYFCDPMEKYRKWRIPAIILLVSSIGISIFQVFFKTTPPLLSL